MYRHTLALISLVAVVAFTALPSYGNSCNPPDCSFSPVCWLSANPGFEYNCGWVYSGTSKVFNYDCSSTGTTSVRLDDDGDKVYQDVSIPSSGYTGHSVSYQFQILKADSYGFIDISIVNPSTGQQLEHVVTLSTLSDDKDCALQLVALSGNYAGQTVRLVATLYYGPFANPNSVKFLLDGFGISATSI